MAHVTDFATGEERLVNETGVVDGAALDEEAMKAVQERLRQDRSGSIETGGGKTLFVRAYNPPLRLIIIGAVHTAQALSPMAKMAGYDVILIDPRSAFATADRFPGVTMMDEWPEPALEKTATRSSLSGRDTQSRSEVRRTGHYVCAPLARILRRCPGQPAHPCEPLRALEGSGSQR